MPSSKKTGKMGQIRTSHFNHHCCWRGFRFHDHLHRLRQWPYKVKSHFNDITEEFLSRVIVFLNCPSLSHWIWCVSVITSPKCIALLILLKLLNYFWPKSGPTIHLSPPYLPTLAFHGEANYHQRIHQSSINHNMKYKGCQSKHIVIQGLKIKSIRS